MKACPYCAEAIKDAATFCRHCRHDLLFVQQLREKISKVEQPETQEKTCFSLAVRHGIRSVIESLATEQTHRTRIILAVLLAAFFQVLSTQLANFTYLIPNTENAFASGAIFATRTIVKTIFQVGSVFIPLVFGVLASLAWPGRHLLGYILLGLGAGTLNFVGQVDVDVIIGSTGWFPTDPTWYSWRSSFADVSWPTTLIVSLIGPSSMFVTGALLGDLAAEWRKLSPEEAEEGHTYGLVMVLAPVIPIIVNAFASGLVQLLLPNSS